MEEVEVMEEDEVMEEMAGIFVLMNGGNADSEDMLL